MASPTSDPADPSLPNLTLPSPAGNRVVPAGLDPIAILGVTASGKSSLAMAVARARTDVELVSVDSMQVYRGMDVGTAKPTTEERAEVRHHVLDLVDPWESFDLASFQAAVAAALADIAARGRRAILVGGTGLYLRAIVDALEIPGRFPEVEAELAAEPDTPALHARLAELDPLAAGRMEPTNRRRVLRALEVTLGSGRPFSAHGPGLDAHPPTPVALVGLRRTREVTARRIEARFARQMDDGFLAEVERLRTGPPLSHTAAQALGYRELIAHLDALDHDEVSSLDDAVAVAVTRTRQFATRQDRWFRRDPRIDWLDLEGPPHADDGGLAAVLDLAERRWGPPYR
jgi:tRNA dimethylallyltransferase